MTKPTYLLWGMKLVHPSLPGSHRSCTRAESGAHRHGRAPASQARVVRRGICCHCHGVRRGMPAERDGGGAGGGARSTLDLGWWLNDDGGGSGRRWERCVGQRERERGHQMASSKGGRQSGVRKEHTGTSKKRVSGYYPPKLKLKWLWVWVWSWIMDIQSQP